MKTGLSEAELKVYDLVVRRFMAVFYPAAQFDVTTRISKVDGDHFKTEGKVLIEPGWMAVYGREATQDAALVPLKGADSADVIDAKLEKLQTRPPVPTTKPHSSPRWKVRENSLKTKNWRSYGRKGAGDASHARGHHRKPD